MQEFRDILRNKALNRLAGLFALAMAPGWRKRHPEIASVRGRLDRIARIIHGGEHFDRGAFTAEWVRLITDIVHADPDLSYTSADLDWLYDLLDDQNYARMVLMLLLAAACSSPHWYTAEQLSEITGLSQITWRKRAGNPDWMAQKRGNVWFFNGLVLRAHGVEVPQSMHVEVEEESSESDE